MNLSSLLLNVLCVWRITHLFWAEDGPWDLLVRVRQAVGEGFFGKLLDCFYCLSLWVAAPIAWYSGTSPLERILMWFAFSGGAILAERATAKLESQKPTDLQVDYHEDA